MQKCKISCTHIVKIDLHVFPPDLTVIAVNQLKALSFIVDVIRQKVLFSRLVEAVIVFPGKQVNTHDAEDEPEDEAHKQHVHDGGYGTHQGVHHNLQRAVREQNCGLTVALQLHMNINTQRNAHSLLTLEARVFWWLLNPFMMYW